jgi:AcrR family transcriptional regulator
VSPKDAYHHGNLRQALLDEALAVIGEKGIDGLSLREVAARSGVSHAAPYHHFKDKAALVDALAGEAAALLDARMAAAEAQAGVEPRPRLVALGMGYVMFAVEQPEYYAAFASSRRTAPESGAPAAEASGGETNAWTRLLAAVVSGQAAGELPRGDVVVLGAFLWSLVHGLAELWRTGQLALLPPAAEGVQSLARSVLEAALGSLGPEQQDLRGC